MRSRSYCSAAASRNVAESYKHEAMIGGPDDALIRRLQFLANSLRRRGDPVIADDVQAVIQLNQSSSEQRQDALWRDPWHLSLIGRLEKRAQEAHAAK
jgi:hypothetical protein